MLKSIRANPVDCARRALSKEHSGRVPEHSRRFGQFSAGKRVSEEAPAALFGSHTLTALLFTSGETTNPEVRNNILYKHAEFRSDVSVGLPPWLHDSARAFSASRWNDTCPSEGLQSWGGHKVTPNQVILSGWTSKHWELANGESDHGRSLEGENRQQSPV
jgi:hypothetical protein